VLLDWDTGLITGVHYSILLILLKPRTSQKVLKQGKEKIYQIVVGMLYEW
jgi:hypothetical protein